MIVDVLEVAEYDSNKYQFLSVACNGTTMHNVGVVLLGKGALPSRTCWDKFHTNWHSWAGYPPVVTYDRGLHKRGDFSRGLTSASVFVRNTEAESPEQLGRGARHGGIIKDNVARVVKANNVVGEGDIKLATGQMIP